MDKSCGCEHRKDPNLEVIREDAGLHAAMLIRNGFSGVDAPLVGGGGEV